MTALSSAAQLKRIAHLISRFSSLPFAPPASVPGAVVESVIAEVRDATRLETYDFVDVVRPLDGIGWQVKSTMSKTPVTWKRAKIPAASEMIANSKMSPAGVQALGNAIIEFCNEHARQSLKDYGLKEIGYARLLVYEDLTAVYFEKNLVTSENPDLFSAKDFIWRWSSQKKTKKKEQLSALHGLHVPSGKKWWAWHGLGENQLHFSGERAWWPSPLDDDAVAVKFSLPSLVDRMSMQDFIELLDAE
jgi:hypothetical protein